MRQTMRGQATAVIEALDDLAATIAAALGVDLPRRGCSEDEEY